jgi:carboxypeptidase C (cathepsin A)
MQLPKSCRVTFAALLTLSASPLAAQNFDRPMPPAFLRAMEPMVERETASDRVITTAHQGRFNGRTLAYHAIVTETPVANEAGETAAVVVSYGYVAKNAGDPKARPVLFVFNGGPGASSSPLHMKAFGPRILVAGESGDVLVNNEHSLLDAADLVFIDPPGTGASMPIAGSDPTSLFTVAGDAKAVAEVVQSWLVANGRTQSPYALVGESYGSARALAMLNEQLEADLPLPDGVALLSLSLGDTSGPVISDVVLLPTLAAVAWHHERIDRNGSTVDQWFEKALDFAQTDYAAALMKGPTLPANTRDRIAAEMETLIGIPRHVLLDDNLRIDKSSFMYGLLEAEALRTGQLDARITRPIVDSNFQPPFDDPSMTLGTATTEAIQRYLAQDLDYQLPSAYRSLNLGINFKWGWGDGTSYSSARFAPYLTEAMVLKPDMSVYTSGGYYDITTPAYAGIFALDQAQVPREKRMTRFYAAGHSVFEDDAGLAQMSSDMRAWVGNLVHTGP